jgi:hypothetical protein
MTSYFPPEWHTIGREAELAVAQTASGITALGRADHLHKGYYTQAFFGLSIGLERIAKLIIISDYAITNAGKFPSNDILRNVGHDVAALLAHCEPLSAKYRAGKQYAERPTEEIHNGIIMTITEFGKLSRYYNLDLLTGGSAVSLPEPIQAWWQRVGQPILSKHYSERQRKRDQQRAATLDTLMIDKVSVLYHTESATPITNIEELVLRAAATRVMRKYGRLYTLQIVRWLAYLISDLARIGAPRVPGLFGLEELFMMFRIPDDRYFRDRTLWSLYAR